MDAILQSSFQNMEAAINDLVDSMTTYNPSTAAVQSLQAANEEFSASIATRTSPPPSSSTLYIDSIFSVYFVSKDKANGLEVSEHQANHARIVRLRAQAEALDEQVRQTVRALAEARREIAAARVSGARRHGEEGGRGREVGRVGRPVGHVELLRYAKAIAKFTVPPSGFRAPEAAPPPPPGGAEDVCWRPTEGARPGAGTPAAEKSGGVDARMRGSAPPQPRQPQLAENTAAAAGRGVRAGRRSRRHSARGSTRHSARPSRRGRRRRRCGRAG